MFEFFIALKYLVPKKRALSTSLISLMSIFVISLVVWLILLFLSVTSGIEKNWLSKLTALNAPLRIIPTKNYYNSYYYLIDKISAQSNYSSKTLGEKREATFIDPYNPDIDIEIPHYWPKPEINFDGTQKDLVKTLFNILNTNFPDVKSQDFEISGALLRLSLYRPQESENSFFVDEKLTFISQMSYLLSHTGKNPNFSSLFFPPDISDLNNLFSRLDKSQDSILEETPSLVSKHISNREVQKYLSRFFDNLILNQVITQKDFILPLNFFPSNEPIKAFCNIQNNEITKIIISDNYESMILPDFVFGEISSSDKKNFQFKHENKLYPINPNLSVTLLQPVIFNAKIIHESIGKASKIFDITLQLNGLIQGKSFCGKSTFQNLKIYDARPITNFSSIPENEPFWPYQVQADKNSYLPKQNIFGVILPKSLKENGVLCGDRGYFSYTAKTTFSTDERRIPVYVAGFYDPGIFSVGNRCIIVPDEITKTISGMSSAFAPEGLPSNGIFLWTKDLSKVEKIKSDLLADLKRNELSSYFTVESYKDYEFAKDLMQQFQSDRLLFILIAIIIIVVACSNIISLLVLLVNDKKKEIAVLQAMGAKKKSIALIFGLCGVTMGILSSLIGSLAAIFTLKKIDLLVSFLSSIQGHSAFNAAFFGDRLPNSLSIDALIFILVITPVISLLAGLIPALKASKMDPSQILRAD